MSRILLKTTIPYTADDWHVGRFAMLREHLAGLGHALTAADADGVAAFRARGDIEAYVRNAAAWLS